MTLKVITSRHSPKVSAWFAAAMLLACTGSVIGREMRADSQGQVNSQPASSGVLVIQGRITEVQGAIVTLKTPNGYPGGPGAHALFVTAGPIFKIDVSGARVLLPDGERVDTRPLAVGDRVLMVMSNAHAGSSAAGSPRSLNQSYFASVVERLIQSDKIVTH